MTDDIKTSAESYFNNGLMCAESVVLSLTKAHGIESDILPKAATAFCGGMSHTCGTCGAVTGAVMGISAILGRDDAESSAAETYAAAGALIAKFEEEFGTRNCHELLECDLGSREGQRMFLKQGLREKCTSYTGRAAELAEEVLAKSVK